MDIDLGGGLRYDTDTAQWIKNRKWMASKKADDVWIAMGMSQGRGLRKFLNSHLGKLQLLGAAIITYFSGGVAAGTFMSATSKLKREVQALIDGGPAALGNHLPEALKLGVAEFGAVDYLKTFKVPIYVDGDTQRDLSGTFKAKCHEDFDRLMVFRRILNWLYENHFYLDRSDFTTTEQAKQTGTAAIAFRMFFDDPINRPHQCKRAPAGPEYLLNPAFGKLIVASISDNRMSNVERFNKIGRFLATLHVSDNQAEVENLLNNTVTTDDPRGDGSGTAIAVGIAATLAGKAF